MSPSPGRLLACLEPHRAAASSAASRRMLWIVLLWTAAVPLLCASSFFGAWGLGKLVGETEWASGAGCLLGPIPVALLALKLTSLLDKRSRRAEQEYRDQFRERFVLPALAEALPGCLLSPSDVLDRDRYQGSGLFRPDFSDYAGFGRFSGEAAACAFSGCFVDVSRRGAHASGSSGARLPHFRGLFAILDRPAPVRATVLLVDPAYQQEPGRSALLVRKSATGDPDFDAAFWTCFGEDRSAAPHIPSELRRLLLEVRHRLSRPLYLSLTRRAIYLAIPTGPDLPLEPPLHTPNNPGHLAEDLRLFSLLHQVLQSLAACPW